MALSLIEDLQQADVGRFVTYFNLFLPKMMTYTLPRWVLKHLKTNMNPIPPVWVIKFIIHSLTLITLSLNTITHFLLRGGDTLVILG